MFGRFFSIAGRDGTGVPSALFPAIMSRHLKEAIINPANQASGFNRDLDLDGLPLPSLQGAQAAAETSQLPEPATHNASTLLVRALALQAARQIFAEAVLNGEFSDARNAAGGAAP